MSLILAMTGGARALPGRRPVPLLLLDADGTVRRGGPGEPFVNGPDDVEVHPEAAVRIAAWREQGGRVAIVSNQGGIGAGIVSAEAVSLAMVETVRQLRVAAGEAFADDPMVDVITWCAHDPGWVPEIEDGTGRPRERCWCRKPAPGLLILATAECARDHPGEAYPIDDVLMVGDSEDDRDAAAAAGVAFMWAADWRAGRYTP